MKDHLSPPFQNDYWRDLKILAERASRDSLSGLLNRETATRYIENYLKKMPSDEACALFIIDLDNFKQVNDSFGHQTGDQLIRQVARVLSGCFRATDIVGRLGGDEFFALQAGRIARDTVREKAQTICDRLQFSIGTPSMHVTASVGVHIATGDAPSFEVLYARADAALYEAKSRGKACFQFDEGECPRETRHVEKAVVQIPLQLHTLLDHMGEGLSLLEVADAVRMIYASPSLCKMMNMECGHDVLPCELSALGKIHPDDMVEYEKLLREGVKSGKSLEHEHRFTTDGVGWRWRRVRVVRISNFNGDSPVMLVLSSDISATRRTENFLLEGQERLKLILDQHAQFLWEVDIPTKTFRLFNFRQRAHTSGISMTNFPDSLIAKGWVHPASSTKFREFAEKILRGNAAGGGAFALRHKMGKNYEWCSVFYRMLPDKNNQAAKAIGVVENLADIGMQKNFIGKERLWEALRPNLFLYLQANLTSDRVESLWIEGKKLTERFRRAAYQKLVERNRNKLFFKEDAKDFFQTFSRDALIDAFNKGHAWITREYRRVDDGGNIRWFSYTAHLSLAPQTRHVHAFIFIQNTEHRRAREKASENIKYASTGLYERRTAEGLAEYAIENEKSSLHALALIRVIGLSAPYLNGKKEARQSLRLIALAFSLLLGSDYIIGELGEDKITVFHPDAVSRVRTRQKIDEAFAFVRCALSDVAVVDSLRFVAAVICENLRGADYDALLSEAEQICDTWKSAPSDSVVFFSENTDRGSVKDFENALPVTFPEGGALSVGQEEDIAFDCLDAMIMADSPDAAISTALSRIGRHYGADRAYTLALIENRQNVVVLHEWFAKEKQSIKRYASGTRVERLPLIKHCLEKGEPILINRRMFPSESDAGSKNWNYGVFPLKPETDGEPGGFLCLENPKKSTSDVGQLKRLLPYITHLYRRRYSTSVEETDGALLDALTGLPNLRAYMDKIYSLTSNNYSSMGVLALDIPQFTVERGKPGIGQCAKILLYVSEVLASIFDKTLAFRIRNAEFIVFCPNTTQDVFFARILRAQSMLQRRYPKLLRFGHTWSKGLFTGEKLANEARAIMRCDDVDVPFIDVANSSDVTSMEWQKHFAVHLQPKVDLRTGLVFSAEALVRGLDGRGNVISPGRFIETMEKAGTLRDLDLHMLHQTLSFMESWRRQGLKLIPVSVNFSRFTLFSPSAPGSVLAILSRYPSISPNLLEIEITETASDVENSTLERAMDSFRAFGLRFALDDFGSRYANLSLFTNVRFDTVKLDQSLTRELSYNVMCRSLVGDIIRICNREGIDCVAEGVETRAQADALLKESCIYAQGFYYGRPMPEHDFKQKYLGQSV